MWECTLRDCDSTAGDDDDDDAAAAAACCLLLLLLLLMMMIAKQYNKNLSRASTSLYFGFIHVSSGFCFSPAEAQIMAALVPPRCQHVRKWHVAQEGITSKVNAGDVSFFGLV